MKIFVNGQEVICEPNATLEAILLKLDISSKVMAVAVNSVIVKKEAAGLYKLKDGDKIEALQFTGGG